MKRSSSLKLFFASWLVLLVLSAPFSALAKAPSTRRVAVLVGANAAPPGQKPLRFAHEDARRLAEVMQRLGRFSPGDIHLLFDPKPADLQRALEVAEKTLQSDKGAETMFVFYYSGHSDGGAIYPHGETMVLSDLKERLARVGARVRIGVFDTCRGGSFTRVKGLTVGPPLDPQNLLALGSEGTALVSSSSGLENAHEADTIQGSFFTHHFIAGLLGAADRNGDGGISLQESFEYAKERTIRDSARLAASPQHPSFDIALRGRQDVMLTQLTSAQSALELHQTQGPLEVIHLGTGVTVIEMPAGGRQVKLALLPGKYMVRKVEGNRPFTKEVTIHAGQTITLAEGQLEATGVALAQKGSAKTAWLPMHEATTLPHKYFELRVAVGASMGPPGTFGVGRSRPLPSDSEQASIVRETVAAIGLNYGLSDRLQWFAPLPAFAYRFGGSRPGQLEFVPRIGLSGLGIHSSGLSGTLDAGVALRTWLYSHGSFLTSLSASSRFSAHLWGSGRVSPEPPSHWEIKPAFGYAMTIPNSVSLHAGFGAEFGVGPVRDAPKDFDTSSAALYFGSVLEMGYRQLPLVQVYLLRGLALDMYASLGVSLKTGELRDRYLFGFSWIF